MDFSSVGRLSSDDAQKIDELGDSVLDDYNEFIGELIASNGLVGEDLLLTASCRNVLVSKILRKFCYAALFEEKLKYENSIGSVTVDDVSLANLFGQILEKNGISDVNVGYKRQTNIVVVGLLNLLKTLYIAFNSFLWPRLFLLKSKAYGKFIYLDTFLFKNSIDSKGNFVDRYYTDHDLHLSQNDNQMIHFVPTLFGVTHPWDYMRVMRRLRGAQANFIVKERCLTFFDYMYAIVYSIMIPFGVKVFPTFRGYSVDNIVRREVLIDVASPALFRALCQYRFVRRLSKRNEKVVGVVNWFENQVKDRALNLSFKKYYPGVVVKGYQGFMPIKHYASLQPQEYELSLDTLPNILYVQNKETAGLYKKTCPGLPLKLAPAFRFMHLFDTKNVTATEKKVVLIALPGAGLTNDSVEMLKSYLEIEQSLDGHVDAVIKVHPTCSQREIIKLIPELLVRNINFSEQSIAKLLRIASVVISSASSVCVEAVASGVPVAILGSRLGVTMNPVPDTVSKSICTTFFTSEDLRVFLRYALDQKYRSREVDKWFLKVDERNTRDLFLKY